MVVAAAAKAEAHAVGVAATFPRLLRQQVAHR